MSSKKIAVEFPYQSNYINVLDSNMHYVEQGQGDPILFIHGIPTSCYLWRNIIPYLSQYGRCIAVDLIGMGKSDKPDIDYRVTDHIHYIETFINELNLKNLTLVMHGWGSVVGFDYAMRNEHNIKALAFLEAHVRPAKNWEMISLPVQDIASVLNSEDGGYDVIMNSNYYVNKVMPSGVLRQLSDEEMAVYQEPFISPGSTKPIWQYLQDLPLGKVQSNVVDLIQRYSERLTQSKLPKLMLYAVPGFITTMDTVSWSRENLPNLQLVDIGDALHYAPESNPHLIGMQLREWYSQVLLAEQIMQTEVAEE